MISLVKYCGAILILSVVGVVCYPSCYNWCPPNIGYGCCDHYSGGFYPGQGYYPGNINVGRPGYYQIPQTLYCPTINCSNPPTIVRNCTDDNDCLRKEKCCTNPCDEGKNACIVGVNQPAQTGNCPAVNNCRKWLQDNQNATICSTDNDCKRSDSCCASPCRNEKVCLKSIGSNIPFNCITGTAVCKY